MRQIRRRTRIFGRRRHRLNRLAISSLFLVLALVTAFSVRGVLQSGTDAASQDSQSDVANKTSTETLAAVQNDEVPPISVDELLSKNEDIPTSYYFRELTSNNALVRNADTKLVAASVTKMITGHYAFRQVDAGNLSLSELLGAYDVNWQLEQLLRQSNNDSWLLFFEKFGKSQIEAYARNDLGLTTYELERNLLSASDAAKLIELVYSGKLLQASSRQRMLSYLQNTFNETLIPAALSSTDTVYHKVGELEDVVNDASIIIRNNKTYVLVIMTNGNGYPDIPRRTAYIHDLTRALLATAP